MERSRKVFPDMVSPKAAPAEASSLSAVSPSRQYSTRSLGTPRWTYLHLVPLPAATCPVIDAVTIQLALLQMLSAHLGDHGAAIPIDILVIHDDSDVYVRVPQQDGAAVVAAIGAGERATVALRVKARSDWLSGLARDADARTKIFDFGVN